MNKKRFALCAVAGFIYIFIFEFIFHGNILKSTYELTPTLWRPMADMGELFIWMLATQFLVSAVSAFIFTRNYESSCMIGEGARFGFMVGLLIAIINGSAYLYMPISLTLALAWFGGTLIQFVGLGIIFSLIYRK